MVLLQFSLQYCSIYIALLFIVCNIHAQSFHPTVSPTLFPTLLPSVSSTVVAQSLLFKDLMYIVIAGIIFFIIGICVCIFAYYRVKKNRAIKKQQQPSYIVIKEKKKMRFKQNVHIFNSYEMIPFDEQEIKIPPTRIPTKEYFNNLSHNSAYAAVNAQLKNVMESPSSAYAIPPQPMMYYEPPAQISTIVRPQNKIKHSCSASEEDIHPGNITPSTAVLMTVSDDIYLLQMVLENDAIEKKRRSVTDAILFETFNHDKYPTATSKKSNDSPTFSFILQNVINENQAIEELVLDQMNNEL